MDTLKLLRRIKENHPANEVMMIVHTERISADRDLFPPRLRRLLERRDRIVRYRKLIGELKRLAVELTCAMASTA